MNYLTYIPTEQLIKEEAQMLKERWSNPTYDFLHSRTIQKYNHQSTLKRRHDLENILKVQLPSISDEILIQLYLHACSKYQRKCNTHFNLSSGFLKTPNEIQFLNTLNLIIKKYSKLNHLEIYPNSIHSYDLPTNFKYVESVR